MDNMIKELVQSLMRSMIMTAGDGVKLSPNEYRMLGISMVMMSIRFAPVSEYSVKPEKKYVIFHKKS